MRLGANVSFLNCLDREEQNTPSRPEIRDTDSVYGDPGTDVRGRSCQPAGGSTAWGNVLQLFLSGRPAVYIYGEASIPHIVTANWD